MIERYRKMLQSGTNLDPGFANQWKFYAGNPGPRATQPIARIRDLGENRNRDMDDT